MDQIKSTWVALFTSIRNSRRQDMRLYLGLHRATILAILITFGFLIVNDKINWPWGCLFATALLMGLGMSFLYFFGEYSPAEKQIKALSDAIELVLVNEPLTNENYRKLYYLLQTGGYKPKMEWGILSSLESHLISGIPKLGKHIRSKLLSDHRDELPLLNRCYSNPEQVMNELPLTVEPGENQETQHKS